MAETIAFKSIYLTTNQGHGKARRISLSSCTNELVALMDADDISLRQRFQLQLRHFVEDKSLSIVGGQISEFIGISSNVIGVRKVPEEHDQIVSYAKKHCPMNQTSVMVKKGAVEQAGGYIDWYCEEDYYLWLRMLENGARFENVPEVLVNVRSGEDMSFRRGGWKYFRSEEKLQRYMLRKHMISFLQYIYNVAIRFGGEVILSNKLRTLAFKMLRTSADNYFSNTVNVTEAQIPDGSKSYTEDFPPFSVAICVYGKDNPNWFDTAMDSIINQTVKPTEIVLVVDGPIPEETQKVIEKYKKICVGGAQGSQIRTE